MNAIFQRREERTAVDWVAVVRTQDGSDIPCSLRDVSATAMTSAIGADVVLPDCFILKIVGRELLFSVRTAWRRQHMVGVVIDGIGKLPKPATDEHAQEKRSAPAIGHTRFGTRDRYGTNP